MTQTFDPRRAEPGQEFTWHDEWGVRHEFKADADGIVRPTSPAEMAAAAAFGLPVARKAIAKKKAEHKSKPADPAKEG